MEEQSQQRTSRYKKRRLRKGRVFMSLLVLLVIILTVYSISQFRSGVASVDNQIKAENFKGDEIQGNIENYLLIGVDSRGEEQSRSDTMIVLSVNKDSNAIKMVSFMRDIYADIPGYQSYKLNTAYYLGGAQLLKDTLSNMFGLPIHHYAVIDFKSFESLIDILAPNGVKMDVEKDMSENIGVSLTKGTHYLSGKELLGYARFRHDANGDFGRVERQQKVVEALKEQMLSPRNLLNYPKFIGAAKGNISSDLSSSEEMMRALQLILKGTVTIEKTTIPIEGSYSFQTFSHAGSSIVIDVDANKTYLSKFLGIKLQ